MQQTMKQRSGEESSRRCLTVTAGLVLSLVLLTDASPCLAQGNDEAGLRARIGTLERELRTLHLGEGAPSAYQEYRRLQDTLSDLRQEHEKETEQPQKRLQELWNHDDVQEWRRKITEKASELSGLKQELQAHIQNRGREVHSRRQQELSALAVARTPAARALEFTVLDYPAVDGSTSTQPLGMIVACKMLGSAYRWAGTARYAGRWYSEEDPVQFADVSPFAMAPGASISPYSASYHEQFSLVGYRPVADATGEDGRAGLRRCIMINRVLTIHAGTHGAYENVINGISDLGLVARRPSEDELALARDKGVDLSVQPFALDAFVFIKNHRNPVDDLSTEQIRRIYSGQLNNWREVGGKDDPITAYRRNRNSGSQELMETLVMKGRSFEELSHSTARNIIHTGMGGPYLALTQDQRGLGYSVYYYEHFMAGSPNTELLAVDGVMPSYETIKSRRYPYVTEVYAVMLSSALEASRAARLRDWLLSPEGQSVVRESGYVPLMEPHPEPGQIQQAP